MIEADKEFLDQVESVTGLVGDPKQPIGIESYRGQVRLEIGQRTLNFVAVNQRPQRRWSSGWVLLDQNGLGIKATRVGWSERQSIQPTRLVAGSGLATEFVVRAPCYDVYDGDGQYDNLTFAPFRVGPCVTLASRLKSVEGHDDRRSLVQHLAQATRGLAQLHAEALPHRDVKPHNILLDPSRGGLLSDHELVSPQHAVISDRFGTPEYLPLYDDIGRRLTDVRIDCYALGITLAEVLGVGNPSIGRSGDLERSFEAFLRNTTSAVKDLPGDARLLILDLLNLPHGITSEEAQRRMELLAA